MAALYCSATLAEIRPRLLTVMPWSFVRARMSALRSRLDAARPGQRRCPARLAAMPMKGAGLPTEPIGVLLLRSISYSVAPGPNRTVSSTGASVRNVWTASPPSVCREVQRAERVARQLACKTFDQMAGELKA